MTHRILLTALYGYIFMPNMYTASTSVYVLTKGQSSSGGITSTDLSASQMITNDVAALVKSSRVQAPPTLASSPSP